MLNFPFSAALLAGGRSRRMGTDKAGLRIAGEVLWKRQLRLLWQLNPTQVFICGRQDGEYPGAGCDIIHDAIPDVGPLGGFITTLRYASSDTLLLLAIDMPMMRPSFLEMLLQRAHSSGRSIIPSGPDGLEPLAAVYHRESLASAEECLRAGELSMRSLASALENQGLVEIYSLRAEELSLFRNINTPRDLKALEVALRHAASAES